MAVTCSELLKTMVELGGYRPAHHHQLAAPVRVDGELMPLRLPPLTPRDQAARLQRPDRRPEAPLRGEPGARLLLRREGLARFRANIFMQRGAVAGAFRTIPFEIRTFHELGLPPSWPSCATSRAAWCW